MANTYRRILNADLSALPAANMNLRFSIRRPRFQFTLRTLLIVTALIAAWLGYHVHWIRQRHEALPWASQHDIEVPFMPDPQLHKFPWSLRLLGEQPTKYMILGPHDEE